MANGQPSRVQRLPAELDRPQRIRIRRCNAPRRRACARAAAPGSESDFGALCAADFDQRRAVERLEQSCTRLSASCPRGSRGCVSFWMSAFSSQTSMSRQVPRRRIRRAVHDRPVDPLRFATFELILQRPLRRCVLRKDHQARRVLIDPMDGKRAPRPCDRNRFSIWSNTETASGRRSSGTVRMPAGLLTTINASSSYTTSRSPTSPVRSVVWSFRDDRATRARHHRSRAAVPRPTTTLPHRSDRSCRARGPRPPGRVSRVGPVGEKLVEPDSRPRPRQPATRSSTSLP